MIRGEEGILFIDDTKGVSSVFESGYFDFNFPGLNIDKLTPFNSSWKARSRLVESAT
ncbi:hypothetical protein KEH51_06040 [[Brevibacterium] frigoritolerans]|uniref:Uncharacterized protein n=1 Tax=Peribacillus frigoritolerans TaxID=450367 RepID=A0A941FGJ4_9BACI|nr:hypothetical protein [Peribacillus frigoritolerans]